MKRIIALSALLGLSTVAFGAEDATQANAATQPPTFASLDANGDGFISMAEADKSAWLKEHFAAADKNNDSKLDTEEFGALSSDKAK